MSLTLVSLFAAALLLAMPARAADGPGSGASPAPVPVISVLPDVTQAPRPHCDSYSMKALPSLDFRQRTCYWGSQLFTPSGFTGAAFWSLVAQVQHSPSEWGQGARGYGERFGTRYTQGMVKSTATYLAGIVSREDPRPLPGDGYDCPMRSNGPGMRIARSLARVFVSYRLTNCGCSLRPAPGRLIGALASGFVQRAWLPASQNTVGQALKGSGAALGGYIGASVFAEFQGDLWRFLGRAIPLGKAK